MKLKTLTLWCVIGAICTLFMTIFYLLLNFDIVSLDSGYNTVSIVGNIISIVFYGFLALFFMTLYKNQK